MRLNLEHSQMFESVLRTGRLGSTTKLLGGNYLLGVGYEMAHFLDANGSDRNAILPENQNGLTFAIFNVGGTGDVVVKDSLAVTLLTLEPGMGTLLVSNADEWGWIATGSSGGPSVSYPNLRIVTAAGDITVDPDTDDHILVRKTVGQATEVFLPAAALRTVGRSIKIADGKFDADSNPITITPDGAETIANLSEWIIDLQGGSLELWTDGVGAWYV